MRAFALSALFCLSLGLAGIVAAEMPQCATRDNLVSYLDNRYGEAPRGYGISNGNVVELLVNEDRGTWSVLMTPPGRLTCLVSAGEAWRFLAASLGEES